jgi:8-oxo-dGTP diphosphatase
MSQDFVIQIAAKAFVINDQGELLILRETDAYKQRAHSGLYQSPGGRIEPGETYEQGLRRELFEETGITDVEVGQPFFVADWRPTIAGVPTQIFGVFSVCRTHAIEVKISDEHDKYLWVDPHDFARYELMDPDLAAIKAYLELDA